MDTLQTTGRRLVFWGALLLFGWAVYELGIRYNEMVTWLSPVFRLVQDGRITFWDYLSRLDWARLRTHLFLLVCALFGVYSLLLRKRLIAGLIGIPVSILLIIFSLGSTPLMSASFWQKLKLIPLAMILLGNAIKLIPAFSRRGRRTPPSGPVRHHSEPYDPFRIKRQ